MKRSIILLSILLAVVFAHAQSSAPTLADAQRAYVAGNWKDAANAYEKVCPLQPAETQVSCNLWGILAMSQIGDAKSFKKAGIKLDSLIETTNPQHENYADLVMTRAQFMLYLGKYDMAATELIHAIETSQESHNLVLQKVCSAVLSRTTNQDLSERCESLKNPENLNKKDPAAPAPAVPAEKNKPAQQAAQPAPAPAPQAAPEKKAAEVKPEQKQEPKAIEPKPEETKAAAANPEKREVAPAKQETEDPKAASSSSGEEYWALQLGAFGVKNNANLLVTNLKKQKIQSTIVEFVKGERTLYLVQTGHFTSKEAALSYGEKTFIPLNVEFQPILKK